MTTAEAAPPKPPLRIWLRLALAVIATINLLDSIGDVSSIFHDHHQPTAYLRFAQALSSIHVGLTPLISFAALILAAMGRLRAAMVALAALTLMPWLLDYVPSVPQHGLRFTLGYGGFEMFGRYVALPLMATTGAVLAVRNRKLALAGVLVCLPTLLVWADMALFTIAVMIYGF